MLKKFLEICEMCMTTIFDWVMLTCEFIKSTHRQCPGYLIVPSPATWKQRMVGRKIRLHDCRGEVLGSPCSSVLMPCDLMRDFSHNVKIWTASSLSKNPFKSEILKLRCSFTHQFKIPKIPNCLFTSSMCHSFFTLILGPQGNKELSYTGRWAGPLQISKFYSTTYMCLHYSFNKYLSCA